MGTPICLFLAIVGVMHTRFQHRDKHRVSLVTGLVLRKIKRFFEAVTIAAPVDIIALRRLLAFCLCGLEVCRYFAADGLLSLGHGITTPLLQMAFLQMAFLQMPRTAQSAVRGAVIGPVTPGAWPGSIGPHRPATPGRTPSPRISTRRGALRPATVSAWAPPHTPGHGLGPATGNDRPATTGPALPALGKRPGPQTLGAVSARALALRRPAGGAICNGTRGTRGTRGRDGQRHLRGGYCAAVAA